MANITRIKNNQITDSTITYTKLAEGTLVGSVFNPNLTLNSNVTILGNLTIAGTPTTIQSTNTYVNDPLVVFNNGYTGSPSYDIGMIANRNLQSLAGYGSVNTAFIWREVDAQWQAIATTETGGTTGSINNSGWANVRVGNLVSVSSNVTGALVVGGAATITGDTILTGATTYTTATGGGLQAKAIGNVAPGTGAFTTLSATGTTTLDTVTAASFQGAIGNATPNTGAFTTLTASGATTLTNSTASTSTSTGALVVTGGAGVGGALYAGSAYDNGNRVVTGLTSSGSGNVTIGGSAPSLTVALTTAGPGASTWGGATQIPSITIDVYGRVSTAGNTALNTVAVTNLGNTAEITANASVGLVGLSLTPTGVTAGNYGSASLIPTIVVDDKGRITSITTNTASTTFTVAGTSGSTDVAAGETITLTGTYGVTVAVGDTYANISTPQDLRSTANPAFNNLTTASVQGAIGNATPNTGAFTTVTTGGLQAVAIGNSTPGSGAFTTGTFNSTLGVTGATTMTTATTGGLQAVAIGNVTPGTAAFTTLAASTWANISATTESTNSTTGALVVAGGVGIDKNLNVGGSVVITGNLTVNGDVTTVNAATLDVEDLNITVAKGAGSAAAANGAGLTVDGANATLTYANADDSWNVNKLLNVNNNTGSTSTLTGALVVDGGAGIAENLYVGGLVQAGTASFASINNTPIGNATPSTGAFTTLSAQTETVGGLQAVAIGNVTPGTGVFTTGAFNTATTGGLQAVAIGNVTPGTGAFTSVTVGETSIGDGTVGTGTVTAGTANLTYLNVGGSSALNTVTAASLQAVAIGNVTPGTGAFTTLTTTGVFTVSGNLVAAATTPSTTVSTGSLITKGGVGIVGNINAGGDSGSGTHTLHGNVTIGPGLVNPTTTASSLTINENTSQVLGGNFSVHVSGTDATNASYGVDSFGTGVVSVFMGRHARGTGSSPTAVQLNDTIGGIEFRGYGTTGFSENSPAGMFAVAKENFTDTAQGTALSFDVIPVGANTATSMAYLGTDGNLLLRSTTTSTGIGAGALVVKGGAGIAGNIHIGGIATVNGELRAESFVYGNSGAQFSGNISSLSTTDTTQPGTGSFKTPGGASIGGNVYVGKNIYVGPGSFNTDLSTPTVFAVDNGTTFAQMAIKNTAVSGSADFAAYSSDGTDSGGWADMGFTGNAFSDPNYTITKPNDGYFLVRPVSDTYGGNLILATSEAGSHNDVVIGVGSFAAESEVARFHGNASTSGNFTIKLPTNGVPAANVGALQVWGGQSISGNAYVGGAVTVNGGKTANYDFFAKGKTDETLIWARPGSSYDQVVIGGSLAPSGLTGGAKLTINSTDSMLLPVGTTGERPGSAGYTDVQGMFRFNTTLGAVEWYTGASWQTATTTFTIITDEQFNGDGSTVDFTLGGATTTAATIVSINGVVQIPTLAYSITGAGNTTLTFTEAPANGDLIDVRRLTTTQTLFGVASPNGKNAIQTDNNGVYIYTGTSTSTATTSWDTAGNEVSNRANVTVSSANTATTIVTMNAATYRSGKFVVQATHGTDYQVMEALVVHDGTTASVMSYGIVQTNGNLGVLSATYSSGNVLLQFVSSNTSTIVRTKSDFLTI